MTNNFINTPRTLSETEETSLKRPLSITIVAWLIILFSLLGSLKFFNINKAIELGLKARGINWPVEPQIIAGAIIGLFIAILSGIFILKGKSWARWLYAFVFGFSEISTLRVSHFSVISLMGVTIYLIFVCLLFTEKANTWFLINKRKPKVSDINN